MKDGIKTSELWLSVGTLILGAVNDKLNLNIPIPAFISVIAYILGRIFLKSQKPPQTLN